jgi:heme/copper-type cytochrome/quinol oxidase subunit 2
MSRFPKVGVLAAWFLAAAGVVAQDPRLPAPKDGSSYWLPPRFSEAYVPLEIDGLWNNIMVVVTITSIVVYGIFLWCMVAYRKKEGQKALFTHGNHTLEIVWTIVPAGILVWLAFAQMPAWRQMKVPQDFPTDKNQLRLEIFAQQFAWNFRLPGNDGKFESFLSDKARADAKKWLKENTEGGIDDPSDPSAPGRIFEDAIPTMPKLRDSGKYWDNADDDDILSAGSLVVPANRVVRADMRSVDVIHAFYIPSARFKQDAVPGKPMDIHFTMSRVTHKLDEKDPTKLVALYYDDVWVDGVKQEGQRRDFVLEIACAELCGGNHTKMGAKLFVLSESDWDKWNQAMSAKAAGENDRKNDQNVWRLWNNQDKVRPWERMLPPVPKYPGE